MTDKRSRNEFIKEESRFLRGTIAEGLADVATGAISEDDAQLTKFHGTYLQDDRDLRPERAKKKLEKAYSFMIRLRLPGGVATPKQWLQLDAVARHLRQQHSAADDAADVPVPRRHQVEHEAHHAGHQCRSLGYACRLRRREPQRDGNPNPYLSKVHAAAHELAAEVSKHLLPQTGAYHEIWLDGNLVVDRSGAAKKEQEPIYGTHYLPRKFKIVIAVPPSNDVDIFAHDLGFIAIVEKGKVVGYNVTVGGGMGMTHGETDTFPRTGRSPRLLHARAGRRRGREDRDDAARLRRPREPQARAPQVHDRGPWARQLPRRG